MDIDGASWRRPKVRADARNRRLGEPESGHGKGPNYCLPENQACNGHLIRYRMCRPEEAPPSHVACAPVVRFRTVRDGCRCHRYRHLRPRQAPLRARPRARDRENHGADSVTRESSLHPAGATLPESLDAVDVRQGQSSIWLPEAGTSSHLLVFVTRRDSLEAARSTNEIAPPTSTSQR